MSWACVSTTTTGTMRICRLTVFFFLLCAPAYAQPMPPYVARGNEVEAEYKAYTARLKKDFKAFRRATEQEAPGLLKNITKAPPKPVPYGYQVLPQITPDPPLAESQARAVSNTYSWRRTRELLKIELPKLEEFEEKLGALAKLEKKDRPGLIETMISDYPKLEELQRLIDSHLQYNRFWQKAIAEDKVRFLNQTRLHDLVLERQELLDVLEKKPDAAKKEKADQMQRLIQGETIDKVRVPNYLQITKNGNNRELVLKLYTDITDASFLKKVRAIFESRWVYSDVSTHYTLKVNLVRIPAAKLYAKTKAPKPGQHIDLYAHAKGFPNDGAVLTTGTNNTFAIPARFVALGPQPISENVLAHEFGHLLGFIDGYLRGYRDRGIDGYEVLEVIPDPTDIMCMPAWGKVQKRHFEKIFESLSVQSTSKQ